MNRKWGLLVLGVAIALAAIAWCWSQLHQVKLDFEQRLAEFRDCQVLAREVDELRLQVQMAPGYVSANYDVDDALEKACRSAGIELDSSVSQSRRDRSKQFPELDEYVVEMPLIEDVSLEQSLRIVHALSSAEVPHHLGDIILTPATSRTEPNSARRNWNLRVGISFLSDRESSLEQRPTSR